MLLTVQLKLFQIAIQVGYLFIMNVLSTLVYYTCPCILLWPFQDTDLLLIKCNHVDGKDAKMFQERSKLFGNKKVESVVALQIQGTHAASKCSAVSIILKNPLWRLIINLVPTHCCLKAKNYIHLTSVLPSSRGFS